MSPRLAIAIAATKLHEPPRRRGRRPAPLTAAMVEIRSVDPAHPHAWSCLRSYFAELDHPSESGFCIPATAHELRPPAGVLLVGYLRSEPIACGALKHHDDGPSEIRGIWVAERVRGLGLGRRLFTELEARAAQRGAPGIFSKQWPAAR